MAAEWSDDGSRAGFGGVGSRFFSALALFVLAFFTSLSLTVIAQHFTGHWAAAGADVAQNGGLANAWPVLDLSQPGGGAVVAGAGSDGRAHVR